LMPVTCGCVAGVVEPGGMVTLAGTVTLEGSLEISVMVTPPAGAAEVRLTAKVADFPNGSVMGLAGTMIVPGVTVTLADASAMYGRALAWIAAEPCATPVTGTVAVVAPAAKVTVAGTVAAAVLLELRLTVTPPVGAAADKVSVKFCVAVPIMLRLDGEKPTVAVTWTAALAPSKPGAEALIFAVPRLMPLICGCTAGAIWPAAMATLDGVTVTFEESLEDSVTVTPPAGAAADRVTVNGVDWPSPTVALVGRRTCPKGMTVTLAVVSAMFGKRLAWITVEPLATPVTGTVAVVVPAAIVAVAGTVATPVLSELRLMIRPPAGAFADSVSVRF
jgi:hypothetical protein